MVDLIRLQGESPLLVVLVLLVLCVAWLTMCCAAVVLLKQLGLRALVVLERFEKGGRR